MVQTKEKRSKIRLKKTNILITLIILISIVYVTKNLFNHATSAFSFDEYYISSEKN